MPVIIIEFDTKFKKEMSQNAMLQISNKLKIQ